MRKAFPIIAVTLLTSMVALFAALSWIALAGHSDGYLVIMTQFFGKAEQIADIAILTIALISGVILTVILFRRQP